MNAHLSEEEKELLVEFHFKSVQGMYFSEYIQKKDCVILFSDLVEDSYYNFIAQITGDIEKIIEECEILFEERGRKLAIYIAPGSNLYNNLDAVPKFFHARASDAYMVYTSSCAIKAYKVPADIKIEEIDYRDKDEYVEAFHVAYAGSNPGDPYANLPKYYSQSLKRSFENEPQGFNKIYVWAKVGNEVAGVGSMLFSEKIAGIYGVGTIEKYRSKGVGHSLMKYLIELAISNNVSRIMLQTEVGSEVEKWYRKMGFKTVFCAKYYVRS